MASTTASSVTSSHGHRTSLSRSASSSSCPSKAMHGRRKRSSASNRCWKRSAQSLNSKSSMINPNDTDKKYQVKGFKGSFGVISSVTEPFCSGCNRLRITADGKMKNCLFSQSETDLITAYRKGEDIRPLIKQTVEAKFARFGGQELNSQMNNRAMISIGG